MVGTEAHDSSTCIDERDRQQPFALGSEALVLDLSGALYWPARKTLIVADLHLEKGSSYARRGQFLPPYDTRETLSRLASVLSRYEVRTFMALGDSLHDRGAHERLSPDDLAQLHDLQKGREWVWICGNHDPHIDPRLGGSVTDVAHLAGLVLRHEPSAVADGLEIAGHLHPVAKLRQYGCSVRRPCFIGTGTRLILPAFGAYTGGLNVLDTAFTALFDSTQQTGVWMLGNRGLYPVSTTLLRPD